MRGSEADDFTVKCEVFVRKMNNEKMKNYHLLRTSNEYKNAIGSGYGWRKYISIEEIWKNSNQYLKNNTLTLGIKVN